MASGDRKKPARARVVLTDISSRAWEHPADKGALVALRKLKGFDVLLKTMSGVFRERAWRLTLLGSAVRVDERQFARLHRLLAEVGRSLDASDLPEMYVQADPTLSAITIGMDKPIIVLSSGLVHHLDDDEMRFVIGHELGHAIDDHDGTPIDTSKLTPTTTPGFPNKEEENAVGFENQIRSGHYPNDPGHQRPKY